MVPSSSTYRPSRAGSTERTPGLARIARAAAERFLAFAGRPLARATLGDLEAFGDSLTDLSPAQRARAVAAVRSLLRFGRGADYLPPREPGRTGPGRPA